MRGNGQRMRARPTDQESGVVSDTAPCDCEPQLEDEEGFELVEELVSCLTTSFSILPLKTSALPSAAASS